MPVRAPRLCRCGHRVALVTVNDPDRRTAVTDAMSAQLRAAVERAEADADVHAVVITGAGKAFCAGADLSALGAAAEEGLLRIYDGFMAVANCTLPTIAAVNGAAVGAGLNLALAADVNGQVFAVRGNEIMLMSQPRPLKSVHQSEGWTPEAIAAHALPALRNGLTPLEETADVFNWAPI